MADSLWSLIQAAADQEGSFYPERPWILSDYDTWHANPYYKGPPVPHPEDDWREPQSDEEICRSSICYGVWLAHGGPIDDEIPF